ncbi:MAG: exodeoxyribonuclease VII large subunit [Lentisphaeraceae bacterium]|nr:exodeoxyribonuclease VII large subunit [Lentisphaeraceae bacterium]
MSSSKVWSVSELTGCVKDLIEDGFFPLWLSGEVGNLTIHRSGHVYFNLKDKNSQISAVYFSGSREFLRHNIKEGSEIEIFGRLTVYENRGNYQINVNKVRLTGVGGLMAQFEELKQKLAAEGLFDHDKKKKVPPYPKSIALITSTDGAAIRDFLNVIDRRFSNIHIKILPCTVQGDGAAQKLAKAIKYCNDQNLAEVIVITRGGGSLEDLWQFNLEVLARAISGSHIPTISAIGHEVDFTICDFVADLRVPTPSAAAEIVIAEKDEIKEKILNLDRRLNSALKYKLAQLRQRLERLENSYVLREPMRPFQEKSMRIDDLHRRMTIQLERSIENKAHKFNNLKTKLDLLNPQRVLERGYSIVTINDKVVTAEKNVPMNAELKVRLADGEIKVTRNK